MINFGLGAFLIGFDYLQYELGNAKAAATSIPNDPVPEAQHSRIESNVEMVMRECAARLLLEETIHTCVLIEDLFRRYEYQKYTYKDLADILERLQKDIKRGASQQYFFHYPRNLPPLVCDGIGFGGAGGEWKGIIDAFHSAKREIEAGVDCFAMGDYPGCIFHMMRIAELGLRLLAIERGIRKVRNNKPLEYAMWGEILHKLQEALDDLRTARGNKRSLTAKKRENREAAISFYSTIISDLQALLPLRDRISHYRDKADIGQAFTSMNRVHEMMTVMAPRLNEANPHKIRWGL
jgi:hypothetical protein